MTETRECPSCEAPREVELVVRDERVTVQGKEVRFRSEVYRCATCGEEFESPEQLDANLSAAREAYSRLYETPTPDKLVSLRSRYGASQKAFGLVLGFGELTMNSYEQGAVPDSTHRLLLKLAENPVVFKAMYSVNSARIGAIQRQRIEASEGFGAAESWQGIDALATALTALQREKIEECARKHDRAVLEQIVAYVGVASFVDYAKLMEGVTWPHVETMELGAKAETSSMDSHQAA